MPATIINVTAVDESISRVFKQIGLQQDALENIDRIINSMEGVWESEAQQVYAESFRETRRRIEGFNGTMGKSLEDIQNFVSECVAADEQTARELRGVNW